MKQKKKFGIKKQELPFEMVKFIQQKANYSALSPHQSLPSAQVIP